MPLIDRIQEDMKTAMRARDSARLSAIRLLIAAVRQTEIDGQKTLDDDGVVAVVVKLVKQRRDAIAQYEQAGRADRAAAEQAEIDVLSAYLPQPLTEAEVAAFIEKTMKETGASGPADMGRVMALLKPAVAGRADMGRLSALVKARLAG